MLVADNLRNHSRHRLLLCRGRGLYLDPKWLSYSDEVAVGPGGVRVLHRSPVPVPIIALVVSSSRCPEVGLGLPDRTRDREKARGDVFGVLDFWAG